MNEPPDTVPSPREMVTSLISALTRTDAHTEAAANPLHAATGSKEVLLTLHVLFQNELLPALDLLDRGLVTRLTLRSRPSLSDAEATADDAHNNSSSAILSQARPADDVAVQGLVNHNGVTTHYVRAAQQQGSRGTSRFRHAAYEHTSHYEVRLHAWSCSCPAFAFSAFPATLTSTVELSAESDEAQPSDGGKWKFGGLAKGSDLPVCKHLLACALVEHSSLFLDMVDERSVSREEMAGWAAGFGD